MAATVVGDDQVKYWEREINAAKKRWRPFQDYGDTVVDAYRLEKADGNETLSKDKYNILFSSTETIRPNLYAQSPIPRVVLRNKDTAAEPARVAAQLLENCLKYLQKEEDFDDLMDSVVEDYLLPGVGEAWVRYEASFGDMAGADGKPVYGDDGKTPQQELLDEMVKLEYVFWKDFLTGLGRGWKTLPWVARCCWMDKEAATKRFGSEVAATLKYITNDTTAKERDANPGETAEVWEIWDKRKKKVFWYSAGQMKLLDQKDDPLKLKDFWPCPRPIRAISNTRTFIPRALYSQYKSQADTLNTMTKRIRLLSEALKVVGVFDGSQPKLADILNPATGNRMIAVDNWAMFAEAKGMLGSVQWLPIDAVVKVLNELLKAREICKQEIYEITGFSDIVRGVSKASETLGAQNIKANWAGARVKKMQAEIQRFARDMLALAGELVAEHCSPATLAVFSGVPIPTAQEVQGNPEVAQQVNTFKAACDLIRSDLRRTSVIDIETDSTLLADEQSEREDRAKMLAASGAFLQQAVPAMEAAPELGGLLGAMLMFTVRSFPSSRPIEEEFEKVQKAMASRVPDNDKDGSKAKAAADAKQAQADTALKQQELQVRGQEAQAKAQAEQIKLQSAAAAEQNRHAEKMAELAIRRAEVSVREKEVSIKEDEALTKKFTAMHAAGMAELGHEAEVAANVQEYAATQGEFDDSAADREHDAQEGEADRQHQAEQAELAQEAALEAAKAAPDGEAGSGEG